MSDFIRETTDLLRRTPEVLRALLTDLPEAWTDTPDTADGWRPRDVVGHLITGELNNWTQRTKRILDAGTSRPFDTFDRFAMLEHDRDVTLNELLDRSFRDTKAAMWESFEKSFGCQPAERLADRSAADAHCICELFLTNVDAGSSEV